MPTLLEPEGKRCLNCEGTGRFIYVSGKVGMCYTCRGSGLKFPKAKRKRNGKAARWATPVFVFLFMLACIGATQIDVPTWW